MKIPHQVYLHLPLDLNRLHLRKNHLAFDLEEVADLLEEEAPFVHLEEEVAKRAVQLQDELPFEDLQHLLCLYHIEQHEP